MSGFAKPADLLTGLQLVDGWVAVRKIPRVPGSSGGNFSVPYEVERTVGNRTERAFLKALDFSKVGGMGMPIADALRIVTESYVFERDLVLLCAGDRMENVVTAIAAGQVSVTDPRVNPILSDVPYIIFEQADGDIRSLMVSRLGAFDEAWSLRVLHGVANGIRQLHQRGITHQDLKPSNVMDVGGLAKVGDLGRASAEHLSGPFDGLEVAGDMGYAPLELLYHEVSTDERTRRRACDMYHLGSLLVFMFTGSGLTALLSTELPPQFHWRTWPRDYRNALPYVRNAFNRILDRIEPRVPEHIRPDVLQLIRELCEPDPLLRGDGRAGTSLSRYSMVRYVSHFDRLARSAEIELRKPLRS